MKRYNHVSAGDGPFDCDEFVEAEDGDWVKHEDVAELEAELAKYRGTVLELETERARAQSAEAGAAALREALDTGVSTLKDIQRFQHGLIAPHGDALDTMLKALNTNAGKELLEKMARLERLLKHTASDIRWTLSFREDGILDAGRLQNIAKYAANIEAELEKK